MSTALNILMLEDSENDAELAKRVLKKENPEYKFKLAMTKEEFIEDLEIFHPDVILADNSLSQFDAKEALHITSKRFPDIPFIMVTGSVSEEFVADIMKLGADDYILKGYLARLPKAIDDALRQRRIETEKTTAIQDLVVSEINLKAIFDSASEAFILTDRTGLIKDFNSRAEETAFHIIEKPISRGQSIFYFIEPSHRAFLEDVVFKVLAGETIQFDKLQMSPVGKTHWINYTFSPVNGRNEASGICITGRDITAKKLAEQLKDFEHNNLHALINNTSDLMWSVDRNFKLITSNQAFNELVFMYSGFQPIKGTDILKDLFDIEKIFRFKKCYERAFNGETFTEIEFTRMPSELWSELSFYPIYEGNDVIGTACFSRNITERKKAEEATRLSTERMSAILNTLPANIVLLDENGFIIEVNDAWKKFTIENGYAGPDYCMGDNYLTISQSATGSEKEDGKMVAAGIKNVLKKVVKEFTYEYSCDGPAMKRWFRMVATPLQKKEYAGAVVMHIDISEIRILELEKLKNIKEEQKKITRVILQAGEKERARLGQELHDNISQLLAAIKMKLGYCLTHPDKSLPIIEKCTEYVQEAMTEARNLSHKMVLPRFEEDGFYHSMSLLVQKYRGSEKVIQIEMKQMDQNLIPAGIKETIYRITQEQLNNIEKYAQASKVFIEIVTRPDHLSFLIRDDGVGFISGRKGDGIGLTNIFNRAESYNGSAKIITAPGRGCTLQVEIPIGR